MALLTPPSTSHRTEKDSANSFTFSFNLTIDIPKLTVTTASSSSSAASSSSSSGSTSTATPVAETPLSASSSRNVIWSSQNSYHSLATPPKPRPSAATTNAMVKERPVKPILKRRRTPPLIDATNKLGVNSADATSIAEAMLNFPEDLDTFFRQRDATPEPSDPLTDLSYLEYPVSLILKPDAKTRELTEGYSILTARLRGSVQYTTDADASWPLFQPLRKNRAAFVDCVVRDLQRAFVDPINSADCPKGDGDIPNENWDEEESTPKGAKVLPSPKKSPKKGKKKGMSGEQVKFARDLCTTAHSAVKLLCVLLCFPAIHGVFENKQLRAMLGGLLAIPIAGDLPTPNARKTCALAIMTLQCQRLPEEILLPTRDRIALALKRGIDGELGKEGKKGSANDGLKAIGDLSIYQPSTFVPVFAKATVLPSILQNLLAPTLALRIQACHALGGLAYALAGLPPSNIHAAASEMVSDFLFAEPASTPPKNGTPGKGATVTISPILRALRTTMGANDATHIAQSPVWALCVCASLIALLGSKMYTDSKVSRAIMSVYKLGAKLKKASLRHLFCAAWRSVNWAWFQPDYDLLKEDEGESEVEEEEDADQGQLSTKKAADKKKAREAYFDLMAEIVETQAALSTVAALLSSPPPPVEHLGIKVNAHDDALRRALRLLDAMANSPSPDTVTDAAEALQNLVSPSDGRQNFTLPSKKFSENARAMLPLRLFSQPQAHGALFADLTATGSGANTLIAAVRAIFDQLPTVNDLRALRKEELRKPWVWEGILKAWKSVLSSLEMPDDSMLPTELSQVWDHLLLSNIAILQDEGVDTKELGSRVANFLIEIITDSTLDITIKTPVANGKAQEAALWTNEELKMKIVKSLWASAAAVFPRCGLGKAAKHLLDALMHHVEMLSAPRKKKLRSLSSNNNHIIAPVAAWAGLCATMILEIGNGEGDATDAMKNFWLTGVDTGLSAHWQTLPILEYNETKTSVWKAFIDVWRGEEGYWEAAVVLLAAPFIATGPEAEWPLSSEEGVKWKDFYEYASNKALDSGMDASATTVIDAVAEIVCDNLSTSPSAPSLLRASELLLDHLDAGEMREVPAQLVNLLHATLKNAYPANEDSLSPASWFVQTLTRWVENTPKDLVQDTIEGLTEGLTVWLRDECEVWSVDDLDYTFLPLYQHLLLRIQSLPENLEFLSTSSPLIASVFSGRSMPPSLQTCFKDAFDQFWELSPYSKIEVPIEGWPAPLRRCLGLEDPVMPVLATPATPQKAGKGTSGVPFPRTPIAAMNGSNIPSPHRPQKPNADPSDPFMPYLPFQSPLSPIRRRRISSGASSDSAFAGTSSLEASPFSRHGGIRLSTGISPSKRRRSLDQEQENQGEKENSSPQASPKRRRTSLFPGAELGPVPVHERITNGTPAPEKKLKLRERMNANKGRSKELGEKVTGRRLVNAKARVSRYTAAGSDDSEDERERVERELVPFPPSDAPVPTPLVEEEPEKKALEPQTPSKKRKRMVLDCVLMPASEMLERTRAKTKRKLSHSASFDSSASADRTASLPESWLTPLSSGRTMKRSFTAPIPLSLPDGPKETKRCLVLSSGSDAEATDVEESNDDLFEKEVTTKEPLPALRIPMPIVRHNPAPDSSSDGPSSDDSQHLGQVTPHHLISPELLTRASRVYSSSKSKAAVDLTAAFATQQRSTGKVSASKQILLRGSRAGYTSDTATIPGSDDSVSDGAPDSSPTKKIAERRRALGLQRFPSLTDTLKRS